MSRSVHTVQSPEQMPRAVSTLLSTLIEPFLPASTESSASPPPVRAEVIVEDLSHAAKGDQAGPIPTARGLGDWNSIVDCSFSAAPTRSNVWTIEAGNSYNFDGMRYGRSQAGNAGWS